MSVCCCIAISGQTTYLPIHLNFVPSAAVLDPYHLQIHTLWYVHPIGFLDLCGIMYCQLFAPVQFKLFQGFVL